MEEHLLRRYHEQLIKHGVANYAWDDCWRDYQISVILCLTIPVVQWKKQVEPRIWWPHLQRGILAFQDLHCDELLK